MNKLITVFGLCYNEEVMLPFFIAHYRKMFPGCRIVLWDNESTDRTHEIAMMNNCEIRTYDTNGKLNDEKYLELKNTWWREAETPWVLIVDIDEHVEINQHQLQEEENRCASLIRFEGWNLVNMGDGMNPEEIKTAVRATSYDKSYLFNKEAIHEINYRPGAHTAQPKGRVLQSHGIYRCFHYKYLNLPYMIARHEHFASRLSPENIKRGYGFHYKYGAEKITAEFEEARRNAKVIR